MKLNRPGPYPCISGCTPIPSGPAGSGMSVGGCQYLLCPEWQWVHGLVLHGRPEVMCKAPWGLTKPIKKLCGAPHVVGKAASKDLSHLLLEEKDTFLCLKKESISFSLPHLPHTNLSHPTTTTPPQSPLPVKLNRPGPYPCISGCTPVPSGPAGSGMSVGGGVSILTVSRVAMGAWAGAAWKARGNV